MLKLIRLELRKLKFRGLLIGAAVADLLLALWFVSNVQSEYDDYAPAFAAIGSYVRVTFIIFAAVLLGRMAIDEYRHKTITVMFTYPISRRKLFAAKLIIVGTAAFLAVLASNVFVAGMLMAVDAAGHLFASPPPDGMLIREWWRMVVWAAAAAGVSLIPLFFGMLRKTMPAAIVSAFVLSQIYLTVSGRPAIYGSMAASAGVAACWLALGIVMSYWAIRDIDSADVD